ncbi:MAG: protein arginine kinase [Planctomycetota bacterium]|nr:protein arginine kinase [Planctomycetota bacterium]MDA0919532.1 protein arginine kinase [Planctomycetota bacterium]
MDLNSLTQSNSEWLRGTGPESDVVVSTRIRLARNLAEFPFNTRADDAARGQIVKQVRDCLGDLPVPKVLNYVDVPSLDEISRQFLVERQLISRELAEGDGPRGVAFSTAEDVSIMVNEEDHLRLQVLRSGLSLDDCWEEINRMDDALEEELTFAFHERYGYLTACPTNVGTGIRVSVMLHLPALVQTREIQKVFHSLQKINLAVRGLYGEGSQALGDFYQISNQYTLGLSETQVIDKVRSVIPRLLDYERRARKAMLEEKKEQLHDHIARASGILRSAQTISSEETMHLLSSVRMGVNLGLIDDVAISTLNELFIMTQPAHLQKLKKSELDSADRNKARAALLRSRLAADSED